MLIEIRKAGFVNKGAELMLYAALRKMKEAYPDAMFVMAPNQVTAPYFKRAETGLLQKAWLQHYGVQLGNLAVLVPRKIREMYGVVLDKEIEVVLDAAGFAYGDQWEIQKCRELSALCKRWRKQGKKVVLLPQAMGPFKSPKIRKYIRTVADNADLIFPRDTTSYQYLTEVVGNRSNISIYPDFTNLVEGIVPDYFDSDKFGFCLVPNYRMIDKTPKAQSDAYIPLMIKCAQYLLQKKQKPFVLIHEEAMDIMPAEQIADAVSGKLPIIKEGHPLKIKGILGCCKAIIGSRFHGLVSALSQGVPALATGWSHKYKMLFHDYGFAEGMLDVGASDEEIHRKIDLIIDPDSRQQIQSVINIKSEKLKKLTEEMWARVFEVVNEKSSP